MTITPQRPFRSPWPGPVPYLEDRADVFFGREADLKRLLAQMMERNLTVLTAWSGVGKSSLIRAALVPTLRNMREAGQGFGPVLILSDWGDVAEGRPASMLAHAIRREIERVHATPPANRDGRLVADFDALNQVKYPTEDDGRLSLAERWVRLRSYVKALCDAADGLVLIIDQAEELLGSGLGTPDPDLEQDVLGIIGELYLAEPRLQILVSLREEYYAKLRALDRHVEALDSRTCRLGAMARSTAREAILDAARCSTDVDLDEKAADMILSWIGDAHSATPNSESIAPDRQADQSGKAPDLLGLQAFLLEVVEWACETPGESLEERLRIDVPLLRRFESDLRQRRPEASGPFLAKEALLRYIDRLFEPQRVGAALGAETDNSPDIMRRLLVRMAPWLSGPGGFKRHVEEAELVFNALWSDLQSLGASVSPDEIRSQLAEYLDELHRGFRPAASLSFRIQVSPVPEEERRDRLSGTSRDWSLDKAATQLVHSGFALIGYLAQTDTGVLKGGYARGRHTCELVHDGLGSALIAWAEKEIGSFRDVCSSVVSQGGEDFRWREIEREAVDQVVQISNMCWLACRLDRVELRNVEFRDCTFKGTLFSRCTFSNCTFVDCDLTGVLFAGGETDQSGVSASRAGLILNHCKAPSVVFKGVGLGTVRLERSRLPFAQLESFRHESGGALDVVDCDLRNALFVDMNQPWVTMEPKADRVKRENMIGHLDDLPE